MSLTVTCVVAAVLAFIIYIYLRGKFRKSKEVSLAEDGWFGRGPPQTTDLDESVRPFEVRVSDEVLDDLKLRLERTRLGEDLDDSTFEYGFQVKYMKEVLEYWKSTFDWRAKEKLLNSFPQYKTTIEGLDVHFIHVKPKTSAGRKRVLLMTHGWPGSVWEFHKIIPMLTNPAAFGSREEDAFEMICPSIPGYGFSEAPHQKGFNVIATARIFRKLMARLGHNRFYVQGGDWGSFVSTMMGQMYPENVLGMHVNFFVNRSRHLPTLLKNITASFFPSLFGITPAEYAKAYPLLKSFKSLVKKMGYFLLQSTKPDTVAFALNDSPVGLAAYILEKFSGWTNPDYEKLADGGLTEKFTLDELLTNVMIYWVTGTIGPSMRYYRENIGVKEVAEQSDGPVHVPTGLAFFPHEIFHIARVILNSKYTNVVRYTHFSRGGHFAALEEPRLLADDILAFVQTVEASSTT